MRFCGKHTFLAKRLTEIVFESHYPPNAPKSASSLNVMHDEHRD
jgi:hypothetical protein